MNTHQRENSKSLYPLLPIIVVTTHLSISRRYFSQRLVCKMALWRSPPGWCLIHFEVILTRRSKLTMQTIHCLNGSWWMVVSLQSPSLLTYLFKKREGIITWPLWRMVVECTDQPKYWPLTGSISSTSCTVDYQGVGQGSKRTCSEIVGSLWIKVNIGSE